MSFNVRPFAPTFGAKLEVSVAAAATAATKLTDSNGPIHIRIANRGTADAAYRFGDSTVAASFTKDPVLPTGAVEVVTCIANGPIYVSTIAAGATGILEFTPGQGV